MPSSSSYAAYLREVALEMSATVAPGAIPTCPAATTAAHTTAVVPPRRPSRSGRQQVNHAGNSHTSGSTTASHGGGRRATDSYEDSYAYDYLQVPTMGSLSRFSAVRRYEKWQQRPHAQAHTARTAAEHPPSLSYTTSSLTPSTARQDREHQVSVEAMQRVFRRLYAVMEDEGRRQRRDAVATGRAAPVPQSRRRHADAASQQTCAGASAAVRVPSIDLNSDGIIIDGGRHRAGMKATPAARESLGATKNPRPSAGSRAVGVKALSPVRTSTDTTALTSSPSKPSTSSSRSDSPPREPRARRHQSLNCSPRCDPCHPTSVACDVNARGRRSRDLVVGAASGDCRTRSFSPTRGRRLSSADGVPASRGGAPAASTMDTMASVRLQWPGQSRTTPSRRPWQQQLLPSPEAVHGSSGSARHRSRQQSPQHGRHRRRGDRRAGRRSGAQRRKGSATAASIAIVSPTRKRVDHEKSEAALRSIATRTCTCYWAEFPDLTMAVNPASHAAGCSYQAHEALYAEVILASKADSRSSSSSISSHSRRPSSTSSHDRFGGSGRRSSSRQRRAAQRRQAFHEPEAKRTRGRAAVMGSTKRRTYIEMIMDAARDAPQSQRPCPGGCSSRAGAPRSPSMVQGSPPTEEAPPTLQGEQPQELQLQAPSRWQASENAAAVTAVEEGTAAQRTEVGDGNDATAAEDRHDEVGSSGSGGKGPSEDVGAAVDRTTHGDKPSAQKQPLPNEESPLRTLSRPRRRPAVGVPGPGSYHVDLAYAASSAAHGIRGAAIPKAARMPAVESTTPGPGTYDMHQSEEKRKVATADMIAAGGAAVTTTTADGGATDSKDAGATSAAGKHVIGKGVVFASTGARQLQLQYGDAYVPTSAWAKRTAALPGPGAYIIDGDRFDQSKPLGEARMGYRFAKSADGAHFGAAAAAGSEGRQGASSSSPTPAPERAGARAAAANLRAALVLPWRDWAGGAYIGTTTSSFVAHPSLAGGDRRIIGHTAAASSATVSCCSASAAAAAAAAAADGSVWRGVGSGVALRLTSQRFPLKVGNTPAAAAVAGVKGSRAGSRAGVDSAASPCREPGPATYDLDSALRLVQRRAPAVSMVFRHDRGPRGPLRSAGGGADDDALVSAVLPQPSSSPDLLCGDLCLGPGPGTYDVRSGEGWCMRRSPQWSFGTAARHAASTVGPVSAVGEDRRGLNSQARDAVSHPGPGAYDTEAGYRALQRSASSALICTAPRFTVDDSDGVGFLASSTADGATGAGVRPGPGTYSVESGYAVLRESIKGGVVPRAGADACAKGDSKKVQYDGPGPGAYTLPTLPPSGPTAYLGMSSPRFPWEQTLTSGTVDRGGQGAMATGSEHPPYPSAKLLLGNLVTPGPGDYDVDAAARLVNRPSAIIGRASRALLLVPAGATSADVGPGSYMLPALPAGRGAVMCTARAAASADAGDAAERPGPGLYDPVDMHASSARIISLARTAARFPDSNHPHAAGDTPGPCAYGLSAVPTTRCVVFDTAPRFSPNSGGDGGASDSVVGPGSYDPYRTDTAAPAHSIARARRFTDSDGDGVGPGAYEVVDLSPPGRSVVMGSAVARPTLEWKEGDGGSTSALGSAAAVPGPGAYSPQYAQVERSAPRVVLARAPAGRGAADCSPSGDASMPYHGQLVCPSSELGPGHYDPQYPSNFLQAGRCYTFGSAPRAAAAAAGSSGADGPGPGAYDVRVMRDGRLVAGGAGSSAVRFGTAPRLPEEGTPAAMSAGPGPGAYMPEVYTDMSADFGSALTSTAVRFGTAARIWGGDDARTAAGVPGPGAYEPNPGVLWPATPSVSFPRADGAHALGDIDTPGPGAYVTAAFAMARATQFGSAPRFAEGGAGDAASVPGPNAYSPSDAAARPARSAHRFGTAARQTDLAAEDAETGGVGPGAYDIESGLAHSSQAPTAAAYSFPRASSNAGDGGHPGEADGGPAAGPGPGAYSLEAAYRATLPRVAAATLFGGGASGVNGTRRNDACEEPSPGPGAYHMPCVFPEGPQWGFGTSMRSAAAASTVNGSPGLAAASPGPGAYDVVDAAAWPSASGVRFGTALRHACADAPADGFEAAAVGVGDGRVPSMPGPGAYSPNMNASSTLRATQRGPTFAHAPRMAPVDAAGAGEGAEGGDIGPGAYDLYGGMAASAAAAHRFGTAPRMALANASATATEGNLGPGSYVIEAADAHVLPRAPAHKMTPPASHAVRLQEPQPGPVTYDAAAAYAATQVARQPGGFTMQGRPAALKHVVPAEGPGPGAYDADAPAASVAATHRFGTAPRMMNAANCDAAVGPGTYDLPAPSASHQGVSFTHAPRAVAVGPHEGIGGDPQSGDVRGSGGVGGGGTPGPGSYDVGSAVECTRMGGRGRSLTIARAQRPVLRSGDIDASPLVGPGTYSPVDLTSHHHGSGSNSNGPSAAFGLAQRPVNTLNGHSDAPGPGTYDPHRPSVVNGTGMGPSFGSAARMEDVSGAALAATPGPGAYAVASSFNATSVAVSTPAVHFGNAKRPSAALNENPGPGSYALADSGAANSAFVSAPSFGQAARKDLLLNTNPGPGAYYREGGAGSFGLWNPSAADRAATASTFGQAEQRPHLAHCGLDTPGPGAYYRASNLDSTSTGAGPSFGVGERISSVTATATPGPGAYFKESLPVAVGSAPGPTFGLAERPGPELNTNPGPGTYYRASAASLATGAVEGRGAGFGLGERTSPVLNDYPGPGAYFRESAGVAAGGAALRGPSFGTGERSDAKLNDNPGPGAYFKDTLPTNVSTAPPRPRRPTAADTLRKLASVGYPTLASTTKPATASEERSIV
ncbi:hypothetical protein CUR178_07644 [Leishmania enriettii]|uniref:Sperm-tail PG-rich repeat n=1 Tax=Leishmania enriettii TaxID=5663 RepID=A0A836HRN5_LEIEN|nr:hypothetical protein CUR178_07644 [Leishmania enriettii]